MLCVIFIIRTMMIFQFQRVGTIYYYIGGDLVLFFMESAVLYTSTSTQWSERWTLCWNKQKHIFSIFRAYSSCWNKTKIKRKTAGAHGMHTSERKEPYLRFTIMHKILHQLKKNYTTFHLCKCLILHLPLLLLKQKLFQFFF